MQNKKERPNCPHCKKEMLPWMAPAESSWGEKIFNMFALMILVLIMLTGGII